VLAVVLKEAVIKRATAAPGSADDRVRIVAFPIPIPVKNEASCIYMLSEIFSFFANYSRNCPAGGNGGHVFRRSAATTALGDVNDAETAAVDVFDDDGVVVKSTACCLRRSGHVVTFL